MTEFKEFPKIHRYSRNVVVTEKLDGTNAAVVIEGGKLIGCQSRTRNITPQDDNYGFAAWAETVADILVAKLGDGRHFGEWWGQGIQRKYGRDRKTFSLFNTSKWHDLQNDDEALGAGISCVPTLWEGDMGDLNVPLLMETLAKHGSAASPGFMKPEGIVIFHTQGNFMLKKTFDKDDHGKGFGA